MKSIVCYVWSSIQSIAMADQFLAGANHHPVTSCNSMILNVLHFCVTVQQLPCGSVSLAIIHDYRVSYWVTSRASEGLPRPLHLCTVTIIDLQTLLQIATKMVNMFGM